MRVLLHPDKHRLSLTDVLFALSEPSRLQIVRTLAQNGEMMCAAIQVPVCKSSCSRHYKVLREAGVIRMRRVGTAYLNSLRTADLDERFPGLLAAVVHSVER